MKILDRLLFSQWRWIENTYRDERKGARYRDLIPILVFIVSAIVLVLLNYVVMSARLQTRWARYLMTRGLKFLGEDTRTSMLWMYQDLVEHVLWGLGCFVVYFILPALVVRIGFRQRLSDWGLSTKGFFKHLWIYLLLYLPVACAVFIVSFSKSFQLTYPFYNHPIGLTDLLIWEFFYGLQFFSLEFFFRGFMLNGWRDRLGYFAIFAMMIPYCMIHFQKPVAETCGAILAGTVLGTIALRTRSIWGGVFIHMAVAFSMDTLSILQKIMNSKPFWYHELFRP